MWYAYSPDLSPINILNVADFLCDAARTIHIGYATSSDGTFWIRSPSNPVIPNVAPGYGSDVPANLPGAVLPIDGDPKNGFVLYYSSFRKVGTRCLSNGIGRATRK
jgi:hypothetical protein